MKRWVAVVCPVIFLFSCGSMYLMVEHDQDRGTPTKNPRITRLKDVIKAIDSDLDSIKKDTEGLSTQLQQAMANNPKLAAAMKGITSAGSNAAVKAAPAVSERQEAVRVERSATDHAKPNTGVGQKAEGAATGLFSQSFKFVIPDTSSNEICAAMQATPAKTDVKMEKFLETEDFHDTDGGVWKQGFELSYSMSDFDAQPLKVFVVPHSHNDPGWLKTVEGYYDSQTRAILNNVVNFLSDNADRKFIWAEMSYLSMWWAEQNDEMRNKFRRLVKNKQLEIVTGGWVMNDEANTHYFAMIDQIIEGHEWIKNNVGEDIIPSAGWAIDPFGHSPTMAYILRRMKFDFMLIQRTHYIVKKQFARNKQLEFKWRQNFDSSVGNTDMLTHMMPFYAYDVPHTCGPDPKVCCQFDFRRLAGGKVSCPWRVNPQPINDGNVGERAELLLDQYRKKSRLFRTNVLLVPLGDDFRYDLVQDAERQFGNYEALMKHINSNPKYKATVKFGTLSDYYNELIKVTGKDSHGFPTDFPAVSGDFYTYTDRNEDYWSGYFTSRPFYKNLDRVLECTLRASELLFTVSHSLVSAASSAVQFDRGSAFTALVQARRTLGLFQHHDGITGTARTAVVVDYGIKLINAYHGLMTMMHGAVSAMLEAKQAIKVTLTETSSRVTHDSLEQLNPIDMSNSPRLVTVYNPLAKSRSALVHLLVSSRNIEVVNTDLKPVSFELSPSWNTIDEPSSDNFMLLISVQVLPLGVTSLLLRKADKEVSLAPTVLYQSSKRNSALNVQTASPTEFSTENSAYKLNFGRDGMLQSIFSKASKTTTNVAVKFHSYDSMIRPGHKPGAYLFFPSGPAAPHGQGSDPVVRVTRGPLCSEVVVRWPQITHSLRLYNVEGLESHAIDIENVVDIRPHNQKEFIMRLVTDVRPQEAEYYSDLNGFTMQKRKYLSKLPMQGNFYPLPAMAFLEDNTQRLSVSSAQPLGSASVQPGWLEVVLDRRLMQDDDRGLGQPVTDNHPTQSLFRLVLEQKPTAGKPEFASAQPTLLANLLNELFMHRTINYVSSSGYKESVVPAPVAGLAKTGLPCNLFMVNLRTLQSEGSGAQPQPSAQRALLFHNKGFDCRFSVPDVCTRSSQVNLNTLFDGYKLQHVVNVSLSLAHKHNDISPASPITIRPMEIEALKLEI